MHRKETPNKYELHIAFDRAGKGLQILSFDAVPRINAPAVVTQPHHVIAELAPVNFLANGGVQYARSYNHERDRDGLIGASLSKEGLLGIVKKFLANKSSSDAKTLERFKNSSPQTPAL